MPGLMGILLTLLIVLTTLSKLVLIMRLVLADARHGPITSLSRAGTN